MEPSEGGFPSKRYWGKVKGNAEEMRACWDLGPKVVADASPLDGPDGDPAERDIFGNLSSSDDMPDLVWRLPRPRPHRPLSDFVRDLALALFHRLLPPHLPPPGEILVLRR